MEHRLAHPSHEDVVNRLKRARGHLDHIIKMIEAAKPCLEVAQQLQAATGIVLSAKRALVQAHTEHCLEDETEGMTSEQRERLASIKEITKYL